jgi:hypothetical protein
MEAAGDERPSLLLLVQLSADEYGRPGASSGYESEVGVSLLPGRVTAPVNLLRAKWLGSQVAPERPRQGQMTMH